MKRIVVFMLTLILVILCACAQDAPTWQEQYDLGVRYLSEGNYEEAVIAFTAAIDIDPQQISAYVSLADTYREQGRYDLVLEILRRGYDVTASEELRLLLFTEELNQDVDNGPREAAQGLWASFQNKDRDRMAEYLESWLVSNGVMDSEDIGYNISFDGENFCAQQDGLGLHFYGPLQLYWGEMFHGVPSGDGIMVTAQTAYDDRFDGVGVVEYYWLDGHWENGQVTGDAEIWVDHSPKYDSADPEDVFIATVEVHCTFDNEEIMQHADVTASWKTPSNGYMNHQFEYEIDNGYRDLSGWAEDYGEYYKPCMLHADCEAAMACDYDGLYKNSYFWGYMGNDLHAAASMFIGSSMFIRGGKSRP